MSTKKQERKRKRIIVSSKDKHKKDLCPSCGKALEVFPDAKDGFAWPNVAFGWYCEKCNITGSQVFKVKKDNFTGHEAIMDGRRNKVAESELYIPKEAEDGKDI